MKLPANKNSEKFILSFFHKIEKTPIAAVLMMKSVKNICEIRFISNNLTYNAEFSGLWGAAKRSPSNPLE
jgi:hypothetical protein